MYCSERERCFLYSYGFPYMFTFFLVKEKMEDLQSLVASYYSVSISIYYEKIYQLYICTYSSVFLRFLCQYLSNFGTISIAMSSGFMDHRSDISSGFRKPFHAKASNHAKRILDGKEALCSGHGNSTYEQANYCEIRYLILRFYTLMHIMRIK